MANTSVAAICRYFGVNRSSYYAWLKRPPSQRAIENKELAKELKLLHAKSKGTYGSPRLTAVLKSKGSCYGRRRIAHVMRKEGLFGCARRKFRPCTTKPDPSQPVSPRIFESQNREALPERPNEVWVGDMTYIPTEEGWLYLTTLMDVSTRKIVGKYMSDNMKMEVVWEALKDAIHTQPEALKKGGPTLVAHSDRGSQYASQMYREKLKLLGITQSMSRSGNCYDNAYAESFFHTLKVEMVHRQEFKTRDEARTAIEDYINNWYNTERLHSALGYMSPLEYERKALAA
jgi:putative transposase